nr:putative ribonuclease H-like domain-containing protein [Tanacetum cinerariifolium]
MTGNISYLSKYEPYDGGYVSFGQGGGKITGKFNAKKDEGYFVRYSLSSKAFRFHEAHMETRNSDAPDGYNADDLESSRISNPTATSKVPSAEQVEPVVSLTLETEIPTVSLHVPTVCLDISPESLSDPRLISKGDFSQKETPSLDNALTLSNRFEDTFGIEADLSNMETSISASPTPTFRIHKDHPKSQIIGPVDTLVQTRYKSNEMEEQSFIATIHQKTNLDLLQFCLFSCFLSQEEPKKIFYALKDPSWAPRAWYGTLSKYLLDNGFQRGTIDQILFIKKHKGEFLLVQMYVDDIIFRSSNLQLCREFEALMHDKFQMSAMRELTFFLGLQVLQKKDGIFLSQDKYVGDILKKFGYSDVRSANTPMDKENPWGKDRPGKDVELHLYRSMIGSLMYLIASKPDSMFAICACHPKLGLWYPKESPFDMVAYSDSDYGGATQDRKSTTEGCQFLGRRLISWQCKKQTIVATSTTKAEYVAAASGCGQALWIQNQMLDYGNLLDWVIHRILMVNLRLTPLGEGSANPTEPHHTPSPHEQHSPHHESLPPSHLTPTTEQIPQAPTEPLTHRDDRQREAFPTVSSLDAGHDRKTLLRPLPCLMNHHQGLLLLMLMRAMDAKIKAQDLEISRLKVRVKSFEDKNKRSVEPTQEDAPITGGIIEIGEELGADKSTELGSNDTKEMVNVLSSMEAVNILISEGAAASVFPAKVLPTAGVPTVSGSFSIVSAIFITPSVGKGSATPTEPHHTPFPQEQHSQHHDPSLPSHPTTSTEPILQTPTETPTETPTLRRYTRRVIQIAQSKALSPAADEPASLLRDDRQGEAFLTVSSLDTGQDKENINKTSALPHESSPKVTSLDADEGSMQQRLQELMDLYTSLQRGSTEPTQEDALIKRGIIKTGDKVGTDKSTKLGSNDTDEMVNVLSSMKAANILTSGVAVVSVSPVAGVSTKGVPTVSGLFPTASAIFTTASVVTPYTRRSRGISAKDKGMEKVVESKVPKKRKLQEHIDAQVAKEMEEEFARENQRVSEQLARDSKIARLHAEEELKMMIEGLDRSNEVIAKHLPEYEQSAADLSVGEKIELINKLVKYQDHHTKILKYQAQQSKPLSKKEQREFYMSVLKSHIGWKTRHFRRMTLEEIKEKIIPVWKQLEDFVPMSLKKKLVPLEEVYVEALQVKHPIIDWEIHSEEKREYWKIIKLGGHTAVYQFFIDMLKQFNREDLHQLWTLVKETLSIKQVTKDKDKELWVKLKRLFEPDFEDQLWTHNQIFMHDPLEWKLYDICGVHHVSFKDQEIFMLVEKDYPLRKGLATMMISNRLQVEQYSQMANDLILKIHNIANSPR